MYIKFMKDKKCDVSRLEIIDGNGRSYVNYDVESLKFSYQDEGKTLKVFVNKGNIEDFPTTRLSRYFIYKSKCSPDGTDAFVFIDKSQHLYVGLNPKTPCIQCFISDGEKVFTTENISSNDLESRWEVSSEKELNKTYNKR